jgi:hypothetical protein
VRSDSGDAIVKIDISAMANGEEAGLAHFDAGNNYCTIGIIQAGTTKTLNFNDNGAVTNGPQVPDAATTIWLRSKINKSSISTCYYSYDGSSFTQLGGTYQLKAANYIGDHIGIYNYNNIAEAGYIDVDWFHYTFAGPTPTPVAVNPQKNTNAAQSKEKIRVQCVTGSDGRTTIKLSENLHANAQVTMYDIAGKSIPFTRGSSGTFITVDHLSTTIAFLKIQNGRELMIAKAVLK